MHAHSDDRGKPFKYNSMFTTKLNREYFPNREKFRNFRVEVKIITPN